MKTKIRFITRGDHRDRQVWSGTISYMAEYLGHNYDVSFSRVDTKLVNILILWLNRISKILSLGKNARSPFAPHLYKILLEKSINNSDAEIIFVPCLSEQIAYCNFNKPVIYLNDATYHAMLDYYYMNRSEHDKRLGNKYEKIAIEKSNFLIFSSEWAAKDAIMYYKAQKDKIRVLPFGANLGEIRGREKQTPNFDRISILFVGINWKRKGGDIAINTTKWLVEHDKSRNYSIDIVGADSIPGYEKETFVRYHGKIDKNKPEQVKFLEDLYKNATFYLCPTKAECAGITFCEASGYGLPILTYSTGGVNTYVKNGINGYTLPRDNNYEDFGKKILEILENGEYSKLSSGASAMYEKELNWSVWLEGFDQIVEEIIHK